MEKYSKEELNDIGIFELRSIARNVGVKSPTTKRHNDLVNAILRVQNGEDKVFSTNKGRPPKKMSFVPSLSEYEKSEGQTSEFKYTNEQDDNLVFCANGGEKGINKEYVPCGGILRGAEDGRYIYNHMEAIKYITVNNNFVKKYNLKVGDYVIGKAVETSFKTGYLVDVLDVNFKDVTNEDCEKKANEIREINGMPKVYSEIKNDKQPLKVVLELEAKNSAVTNMRNDSIYFYSEELANVKKSYNAALDSLYLVKNLCKDNKPFTLYLVDIDYIFITLNLHLRSLSQDGDKNFVDAGYFLKTLFSCVNNSEFGNIVVYENRKYKRNEYLDAILNKYL